MKNTVFNWEWTLGTLVLMCFENLLHAASTPKDIIQKKLEQLSVTIARIETLFAPSASKLKTVSKPKLKVHSITMFFSPYSWRICRMIFKFWLENKVRYEGLMSSNIIFWPTEMELKTQGLRHSLAVFKLNLMRI